MSLPNAKNKNLPSGAEPIAIQCSSKNRRRYVMHAPCLYDANDSVQQKLGFVGGVSWGLRTVMVYAVLPLISGVGTAANHTYLCKANDVSRFLASPIVPIYASDLVFLGRYAPLKLSRKTHARFNLILLFLHCMYPAWYLSLLQR
ncbi:hypothetical protein F5B17DRAFT_391767 [Nemania serpens]|nr:hypothetical protein F5B17DRAFT_391767 [Nemania serpens]